MPATQPTPREMAESLPTPVALLGLGVEGRETLAFLQRQGVTSLHLFDQAFSPGGALSAEGFTGLPCHGAEGPGWQGEWEAALAQCRTIVRSPGIRPDVPWLAAARAAGARVTSATRLFLAACPGPVAGVTGTLGKGTTVAMIEAALRASGLPCHSGGNIGTNPLSFLENLTAEDRTVLELSSFQLMDLEGRRPEVAVVLRTTSEHLDWHRDVGEYRRAKGGLLASPGSGQRVIVCADAPGSREVAGAAWPEAMRFSRHQAVAEGIGLGPGGMARFAGGVATPLPPLDSLALPGAFNRENAAAALLAAEALGAEPAKALAAIAAFGGLPHRLEYAGRALGVECYNDSYATRPDATVGALESFAGPLVLIAGGSEKHADFQELAQAICGHPGLRQLVLIGSTAGRIAAEVAHVAAAENRLPPAVHQAESLAAALDEGLRSLAGGGVLLFSPACASFDMFPNYKVRGERFRALVQGQAAEPPGPEFIP